jgi:hypothetical protein
MENLTCAPYYFVIFLYRRKIKINSISIKFDTSILNNLIQVGRHQLLVIG